VDEATIAITVTTGLLLVTFLGFLIWGIRSGQFKNIEDAKYRIFDDRGDDPPPDATSPVAGPVGGERK
jgi:cbb3-type cytochrome oxidase maturation protein